MRYWENTSIKCDFENIYSLDLTCWIPGVEGTTVTAHEPIGPFAAPFCIMAAAAAAAAAAVDPGVPEAPCVKTGDAVTAGISMLFLWLTKKGSLVFVCCHKQMYL